MRATEVETPSLFIVHDIVPCLRYLVTADTTVVLKMKD